MSHRPRHDPALRHTGGDLRRCRSVRRTMFAKGSKALERRHKGDARRARIRALRIAQRQLRPHGLRAVSVRHRPDLEDTMVDVYARGSRLGWFGPAWVSDVLGDNAAYGPLLWIGETGSLMTKRGLRVELGTHCRELSVRCHPWCECEHCTDLPF